MEANPAPYAHLCDGRILATLFYEPSTRTRLSFESAMLRLGGKRWALQGHSFLPPARAETVEDTARVVSNYADVIAMRHPQRGAPPGVLVCPCRSSMRAMAATRTLPDHDRPVTIRQRKGAAGSFDHRLLRRPLSSAGRSTPLTAALSQFEGQPLCVHLAGGPAPARYVKTESLEPTHQVYTETDD